MNNFKFMLLYLPSILYSERAEGRSKFDMMRRVLNKILIKSFSEFRDHGHDNNLNKTLICLATLTVLFRRHFQSQPTCMA